MAGGGRRAAGGGRGAGRRAREAPARVPTWRRVPPDAPAGAHPEAPLDDPTPVMTDPADLSPRDRTAFAENWRSVLVWDALLGVTVVVAGVLVGVLWSAG